MHPLDILSDSPHLYLFQKVSNKTNLGGFLFLIYLIIIIIIIVYYIVDYTKNEKYIIESFTHFNMKTEKEKEERNKDQLYNPNINFTIDLTLENEGGSLGDKFIFFDGNTGHIFDRKYTFNTNISHFKGILAYICDKDDCSDYFDYIKTLDAKLFYLNFSYNGFRLEHQNKKSPIIRKDGEKNINFTMDYPISFDSTLTITNNWKAIKYREKKELFQSAYEDGCGYIENYNTLSYNGVQISDKYVYICAIRFKNDNTQYLEYIRKQVSLLDLLANILSLMANIFTGTKFIFSFYSSSFNNYKIIEKLINKSQTFHQPTFNKLNDIENNNFISIKDDSTDKHLIEENINDNKNDVDNDNLEEDDELNIKNKRIEKIHFFDFFLNNIYCCFKKRRAQKIIYKCNEIVYKYASIDTLIKNQILIDNFFKDYNWNNPALNSVENNDLFIQLKTFL